MKRLLFKIAKYSALAFLVILLCLILIPRNYGLAIAQKREGISFWTLSDGAKIAYNLVPAQGEKKKYPIIFLQGGPGGPIYDRTIQSLSFLAEDGYDVYLYDQLGCGYSDRLDNIAQYTVSRHLQDLNEIVEGIAAEKLILIGQSWGAILGTLFMAGHEEQVEKLILTSPGPILPINYALEKEFAADSLGLYKPEFTNKQGRDKVYNWRASAVEFCAKRFNCKLATDQEMDGFAALLYAEMGRSTQCKSAGQVSIEAGAGYYAMIKTAQSFKEVVDPRRVLRALNQPVLIMRGQCDGMPWGYAAEYLSLFKNSELAIIKDAGHSIATTSAELYRETILVFLNQ